MQKRTKIITGVICATVILGGTGVALAKPAFITQLVHGTTAKAPTQIVEAPATKGKLTLPEGEYEGEIKNGMANGKGTITYPNGDYWVGGFTDNKWHGIGTITYLREGQPPNSKELDVDKIQVFVDTRNADGLFPEPAGINDAPNDGYYHMRTDRPAGIYIYQIIFHEGFRPAGLKAVDVHIMARSNAKENELIQDRDEIVSITGSTGKVYDMIGTKRTGVNTNAYFVNFQEQEITEYQDVSINEKTITSIVVRRDGKDITVKPDKDTKFSTTYPPKATTTPTTPKATTVSATPAKVTPTPTPAPTATNPPAELSQMPQGERYDTKYVRSLAAWITAHPTSRAYYHGLLNPKGVTPIYNDTTKLPVPPGYVVGSSGDLYDPVYLNAYADYQDYLIRSMASK